MTRCWIASGSCGKSGACSGLSFQHAMPPLRLPGKALREIAGKPMLQWVHERACAARCGRGAHRHRR